jgi:hypothetical protein
MNSRGWTVSAAVAISLILSVSILANFLGARDMVLRSPAVVVTPRAQPGPVVEYEPKTGVLAFEVAFTAENTEKANHKILGIRGSLNSGVGSLAYFVARDSDCRVDRDHFSSVDAGTRRQIRCRLSHVVSAGTLDKLQAPGPLMLHVRFQGEPDAIPSVRYCINATDSFWREFLGSRVKARRLILNPEECR